MSREPGTEIQRRAVEMLGEGLSAREVAEALSIHERTVRKYREDFAGEVVARLEPAARRIRRVTPAMQQTLEAAARSRDSRGNPTSTAVRAAAILVEQERRYAEMEARSPGRPSDSPSHMVIQASEEDLVEAMRIVRAAERSLERPDPEAEAFLREALPDLPD